MHRESPKRFGRLVVEDWGQCGCKATILNDDHPDESVAQVLDHNSSAELARWLVGAPENEQKVRIIDAQPGDFGRALTKACAERGTVSRLCRYLKLNRMMVQHWVWGDTLPLNKYARSIAEFFRWDPDETARLVDAERVARAAGRGQKTPSRTTDRDGRSGTEAVGVNGISYT